MILELRLKNFRQYKDQTLKFQEGLNLITGANNAGKSTIFYAIEYALFGRVGAYKSIAALLHPKARGMGVELIFTDSAGVVHRLQRVHQKPPKSRTKVVGHFTLKVRDDAENPEAERYLLSTDFKDTEESLSLALFKVLGVTKRLFETAVHTRQGQCSAILSGAPQLDMVLGVTAAIAAADQLRSMALDAEKKGAAKPVIIQNVARLIEQLKVAEKEEKELEKQLTENEKEQKELAKTLEKTSATLVQVGNALKRFQADREARENIESAQKNLEGIESQISVSTAKLKELTVVGGGEKLATEVKDAEQQIADSISHLREEGEEKKRHQLADTLTDQIKDVRQRDLAVWKYDFSKATREELESQLESLSREKKEATQQIEAQQKAMASPQEDADASASPQLAVVEIPSDFEGLQTLKQESLLEEARVRTTQEHKTENQERLLEQRKEAKDSIAELGREKASQEQELANLQQSAEQAETFRKSAAAFKWLQTQLRETAAEHFGEKILDLHRKLSGGQELTSVRIDAKNYMVHVKSKGYKTESPAYLFQGGGQCVMLGLAFKLALAQWLGNVPFLLLDEPTDGLDSEHLKTMFDGLTECPATKQILMITHVPWDRDDLPVTHVDRVKNVSEVKS